ncbi:MAG: efflux RND transporter periplasmic adaptor subunit, partial [Thermodesulfobacteriota bacterium]
VVISELRSTLFKEEATVSGSVAAVRSALVSARIPGTIDEIYVDEGDVVTAGASRLFQTDDVKLKRGAEIAEHQVKVAMATVSASRATVARVEANVEKIRMDLKRYQRLHEQGAITQNALEIQETRMKSATAELAEAKAGLELARTQEMQARSNLAISVKDLSDALVVAPISGTVSRRMLEPGEMASPGTPVIRIDDLSLVEISAFLPENLYARVLPEKTRLSAVVQSVRIEEAPVAVKNPVIHAKLRSFEIQARLQDPPKGVVPGAMADVTVLLQERQGLGAPREAVLQRRQGPVIFTVADGRARMLPVQTGLETNGWIEITGEGIAEGMPVVRMGQEQLNDGAAVRMVREGGE